MFVGCGVCCSSTWALGSSVEGVGIVAVSRPDTDIKVEGVASGGVSGGNVQARFDGFASAVGDVPLGNVLLSSDPLVGGRTP